MEYKELIDCYFDDLVRKSEVSTKRKNMPEYEKQYDAPKEKLSFAGADEIERLSWNTTMRLCDTEEYADETAETVILEPKEVKCDEIQYAPAQNEPKNDYGLSRSDIAYIAALCESSVCGVRGIDDEATVERINEAFSDGFGDVIIEDTGDGFAIIEDYKEEIIEWLRNI